MVKFLIDNKGLITQLFQGQDNDYSKKHPHAGIDWKFGYGTIVRADNAGYVYKTYRHQDVIKSNWVGMYQLVPLEDGTFMEVCMGHFSKLFVKEGETIPAGFVVGKEGNRGKVFSGGVEITPEMQRAGDKRGSHVHESYRPVKRTKKTLKTKHYLTDKHGILYRDGEGFAYQIINTNNARGCVNPFLFSHKLTLLEKINNTWKLIKFINKRYGIK